MGMKFAAIGQALLGQTAGDSPPAVHVYGLDSVAAGVVACRVLAVGSGLPYNICEGGSICEQFDGVSGFKGKQLSGRCDRTSVVFRRHSSFVVVVRGTFEASFMHALAGFTSSRF